MKINVNFEIRADMQKFVPVLSKTGFLTVITAYRDGIFMTSSKLVLTL